MMNLEWLKNINTLLTQAIELLEDEFSAGKWLDFATRAVKRLGGSISPSSPFFSQDHPVRAANRDDESPSNHSTSSSPENTTSLGMMTEFLRYLEPVQNIIKQLAELGPVLQKFLKPKSDEKPKNTNYNARPNPGSAYIRQTALNSLFFTVLPVFLIAFLLKFR